MVFFQNGTLCIQLSIFQGVFHCSNKFWNGFDIVWGYVVVLLLMPLKSSILILQMDIALQKSYFIFDIHQI